MDDTQPEAAVYNGPGGWWPGTGYGQTAPAARRLNQYFLGVAGARAWCLLVLAGPGAWCLKSANMCQLQFRPLSTLPWPDHCFAATYFICPLSRSSKR